MLRMDTLPSSDFRKKYARLRAPTTVTVLDRVIGTWYPAGTLPHVGTGTAEKITPPAMAGFGRSSAAPKPVKKGKS